MQTKTTNSTKLIAEQAKIYFEAVFSSYGKHTFKPTYKVRTVYDANQHFSLLLVDLQYMRISIEFYGRLEYRYQLEVHNLLSGKIHSVKGKTLNDLYYAIKADSVAQLVLPIAK